MLPSEGKTPGCSAFPVSGPGARAAPHILWGTTVRLPVLHDYCILTQTRPVTGWPLRHTCRAVPSRKSVRGGTCFQGLHFAFTDYTRPATGSIGRQGQIAPSSTQRHGIHCGTIFSKIIEVFTFWPASIMPHCRSDRHRSSPPAFQLACSSSCVDGVE